jgi:methionine sulfoxide reductase heme-binding subunit
MQHHHWLAAIPKHLIKIKLVLLLAGLIPLAELIVEYYRHTLGFDPLDRITRSTGNAALILLLVSLTVTPLRHLLTRLMIRIKAGHGKRVSDWNWVIRTRRMIGLLCFFYATLHLGIYFWMDQGANVDYALRDMSERPFIAVGMIAFLMLVPLALTANDYSMRLLGKNWRRLHRTVYVITLLVIIHYWMLTKVGVNDPIPFALIVIILFGWRLWFTWMSKKCKTPDYSVEIPEREPIPPSLLRSE